MGSSNVSSIGSNHKTVFVKYSEWKDEGHPLLDDVIVKGSKIVKVNNLLELSEEFKGYMIADVKILETTYTNGNIYTY